MSKKPSIVKTQVLMIGGSFCCRERCPQRSARRKIVKKLAKQGVLTYITTRSCCGARCSPWRKRQRRSPTAATRSGRFIRHWRRSHRSPLEYPHTLRVRVACLDGFIDLCQSVKKEFLDRLKRLVRPAASAYSAILISISPVSVSISHCPNGSDFGI